MAHILRLDISNVKGITAFCVEPDGNTIIIAGPNGAGKSSALDAIEMALGGKGHVCSKPLHDGTTKGYVIVDTEEWTAKRTFTEKDSYIEVTTKEGYKIPRAQEFLDKAVGGPCLDPLEFTKMKPDKQRAVLMELLGLDFTALDAEAKRVSEERTFIGRERDSLKKQGEAIPLDPSVPKEEISVASLMSQLREAEAKNRENAGKRDHARRSAEAELQAKRDLERIEQEREQAIATLKELTTKAEAARVALNDIEDVDTEPISKQIEQADEINAKVRDQNKRRELGKQYKDKNAEYEARTTRLQEIAKTKEQMISDAKFPVAGVTFGEDGIMLNGIPFDQASSAEQLKVATAMALASNPDLRVILIRDGSLLDEQSLKAMQDMAAEKDAQVWIERVGEGPEASIIIRDGTVAEDRTGNAPKPRPTEAESETPAEPAHEESAGELEPSDE